MKITLLEPKEYDAKFLRIDLSDAEEEVQELPADFPLRAPNPQQSPTPR